MPPVDPASPVSPPPAAPPPVWGDSFSGDDRTRSYRVRSEETWAAAREDYECGWTAEEICRRYDIGLSAFRQRARREEWRKCDHRELEPEPFRADPEAALSTAELADLAWRSLSDAMRRGRVYEARAWMKLAAELKARQWDEERAARRAEAPETPSLAATALAGIDEAMRAIIATSRLGKARLDAERDAAGDDDGEDEAGDEDVDLMESKDDDPSGAPAAPPQPTTPFAADPGLAAYPGLSPEAQSAWTQAWERVRLHRMHSDIAVQSPPADPSGSAAADQAQPQEPETGEPD